MKLVRVSLKTGLRAGPADTDAITEAFKPGEEPDDPYSVIGLADAAQTSDAGAGDGAGPGASGSAGSDAYNGSVRAPGRPTGQIGGRGGVW